ncbi:MAG: hypothetical protein IJZ07_06975 [Clostridia bacterium]|nr:hypothetical protein [Clostridia bacterium]
MEYRVYLTRKCCCLNDFLKYKYKMNSEYGIMIIRFTDKDISDVVEIFKHSFKEEYITNINGKKVYISAAGKNNVHYVVTDDGIEVFSVNPYYSYKFVDSIYKSDYRMISEAAKAEKKVKKAKADNPDLKHIEFLTPSRFKKFIYTHPDANVSYRIKRAKKDNQPLVIYFHGGGLGGNNNRRQFMGFNSVGIKLLKKDCNILVPQLPNGLKSIDAYIHIIKELAQEAACRTKADKNRIYVFGGSLGGHQSWSMAWLYPDFIACAMPLMGNNYNTNKMDGTEDFGRIKDVPLWVGHSSDDKVVPIENDDYCVEMLRKIGGNVKYTRWEKYGHKFCLKFYKNEKWVDWMFEQSLENR